MPGLSGAVSCRVTTMSATSCSYWYPRLSDRGATGRSVWSSCLLPFSDTVTTLWASTLDVLETFTSTSGPRHADATSARPARATQLAVRAGRLEAPVVAVAPV